MNAAARSRSAWLNVHERGVPRYYGANANYGWESCAWSVAFCIDWKVIRQYNVNVVLW